MNGTDLINLDIPTTSISYKPKTCKDDGQFFVICEYSCSEDIEIFNINEKLGHDQNIGLGSTHELVFATISFSFNSIMKGDF